MSADPVLSVRDLCVEYDRRPVLSTVSLAVESGAVLAVLGPSGAGKSTLLHAVAGFTDPVSGEVRINGRLVASAGHLEPPDRRDVGVVFQSYALWPHLSAVDTVAYPLRRAGLRRTDARRQAQEILERLDVGHLAGRRPGELSGGEQQRVGLARALARRPALYLFDEPTAHLDAHVRAVFLAELLQRQKESGAAAVYATHDAEEALGLADRVALLDAGRVVQVGTPQQVYDEPVDLWAARLTGPASAVADPDGRGTLLVRPEWARLGQGPFEGTLRQVWFRGPHCDHLVDSDLGPVTVRVPSSSSGNSSGSSSWRVGERVTWGLVRSWRLPGRPGARPAQVSSIVATPE